MTQKERLLNRLAGRPVDKIPNLNIVMLFAARYAGIEYGKYCSDYHYLVEAQLKTAEDFGLDILSTMSDAYREAADYGARVRFEKDDLPVCETILLNGAEDLPKLKLWNPLDSIRMLDRIKAVELFKHNVKDQYPILGWVEGPWAEFTDLASLSEGMMLLYDEPEFVIAAMDLITEQAILCAKEQIKAGADVIGIGDAAASLVSADTYCEYILPRERKIIEAVHAAGGKTKLHICGNISHLMPHIVESKTDIIDIDFMVDFNKSVDLSQGRNSICGNINPVDVLLQGTVEEIRQQTRRCAQIGDSRSIVSGGCEVPKMTPFENLKAVDDELKALAQK